MADVVDVNTPDELAGELDRMDISSVVLNPNAPLVKKLTTHILEHSFSLNWDEFRTMTRREVWDAYANTMVRRIIRQVRRAEERLGRKLVFRLFNIPTETPTRKILTYEKNGVFIAMVAIRHNYIVGVQRSGAERLQEVVEMIFRAEIALEGDEQLGKLE